jgi:hypothetical protein
MEATTARHRAFVLSLGGPVRPQLRHVLLFGLLACLFVNSPSPATAATGSATLYWTAPGDDSLTGRATAYDIRYSLSPITAANFPLATRVVGVPAPKTAGSAESLLVTDLVAESGYYFALKTADEAANWSRISNAVHSTARTTDVGTPLACRLSGPWPNPARSSARWSYVLTVAGPVELVAFDVAGRRVRRIAGGLRAAGQGEIAWDLRDDAGARVAPGMYLVRAALGGQTTVRRLAVTS